MTDPESGGGEETSPLKQEYDKARSEHQWYRQELLEMVGDDDQYSDTWEEYRRRLKETGKQVMELSKRLPEQQEEGDDG